MLTGSIHGFTLLTRLLLVLAMALSASQAATAAPQVTVSIKPLQLIAGAITEGVTTPALVWAQGQDPHHVSLRPSERRLLADAQIVVWIGPMLERPLAGLVADLDAQVITVQDLDGLELLTIGGQPDPHVWVDTRNAGLIASALADTLVQLDAANAAQYRNNLADFQGALASLNSELRTRLANAGQREWAVYHHALRYLEREFGLLPPLTLADSENNAPGIRTVTQVRAQLQQKQLTCMLAEPGVNEAEILTMLDVPGLEFVQADVMGQGLAVSGGDYIAYMQSLGAIVAQCLGAAP